MERIVLQRVLLRSRRNRQAAGSPRCI